MPTTPEGKAIVARNAISHGLYADVTVCAGREQEGDWLAFHDAIVESLAPSDPFESSLASRAAALLWRLRRVPAAEAAAIERQAALPALEEARRIERELRLRQELGEDSFYAKGLGEPSAYIEPPSILPDDASLGRVIRTEAHLDRQLLHTLHALESLQERRAGRAAPLARVDVHGLPGT